MSTDGQNDTPPDTGHEGEATHEHTPPPAPHTDEMPEWGRTLTATVEGLATQVQALSSVGSVTGDGTGDITPDSKPKSVPWTHLGSRHG